MEWERKLNWFLGNYKQHFKSGRLCRGKRERVQINSKRKKSKKQVFAKKNLPDISTLMQNIDKLLNKIIMKIIIGSKAFKNEKKKYFQPRWIFSPSRACNFFHQFNFSIIKISFDLLALPMWVGRGGGRIYIYTPAT